MATQQHTMVRKEKAGKETVKKQRKIEQVTFEIIDDDIILKSGSYLNRSVREMYKVGAIERDYVVSHLWFTNDEAVVKIINSMCAR
jgi:hypothetical protein